VRFKSIVVELLNVEQPAGFRADAVEGFLTDEFLLGRLLGLGSVAKVAVDRSSRVLGLVCRSAMPGVGVEYDHSTRQRFEYYFIGMREERVIHFLVRYFAAEVGSGNEACGSVGDGEIV
jgi:hypothetical protein